MRQTCRAHYNKSMRYCVCLLALVCGLGAADRIQTETIRGKLIVGEGNAPAIETSDHRRVAVDGDEPTHKVLNDRRVNGFEVEARGHFDRPNHFLVDPQHTHSLL